jgi:hypothetical protein
MGVWPMEIDVLNAKALSIFRLFHFEFCVAELINVTMGETPMIRKDLGLEWQF